MNDVDKPAGRRTSRQLKLEAARQRRLGLDQEARAREGRIDNAVVDFGEAWEARSAALAAVAHAEASAADALNRLFEDRVTSNVASELVGVPSAQLRRLPSPTAGPTSPASKA